MKKENICDTFLNTYRDLEEVLGAKYGQKLGTVQLFAAGEGARFAEELNLFREMRNLLSHHGKINGESAVLPSEAALERLREILRFAKDPPAAISVATEAKDLFCARMEDSVESTIGKMEEKGYSHVPVLDESGVLQGVFSVGTLFSFAKAEPGRSVAGLRLLDMARHLPTESHTTEKFIYASPEATLYQLKGYFAITGPGHRRVAAVFITENGGKDSPLMGMITPWDVIKGAKA